MITVIDNVFALDSSSLTDYIYTHGVTGLLYFKKSRSDVYQDF